MDAHREVLETTEIGLKCLLALVIDHPENAEALRALNGVSLVVTYMVLHKSDYDVCTVSCELLLQLHFTSQQDRETLRSLSQLGEDGLHARPAGRFEDIAQAWRIYDLQQKH